MRSEEAEADASLGVRRGERAAPGKRVGKRVGERVGKREGKREGKGEGKGESGGEGEDEGEDGEGSPPAAWPASGALQMVSYRPAAYSPKGMPTMQRLNVLIAAGEHVALVGRSGAGGEMASESF